MCERPPCRIASGEHAGGAIFVTDPCILDSDVGCGFQSHIGREIVIPFERPFSESVETAGFIAGPNALRTLKMIRTLITPTTGVRQGKEGTGNRRTVQTL